MRPKTPLPPGEITNVIYRIQCSSCEMNYIGETGKRLQTRVGEHMRAVRRMDQLSLMAEHCANSGHTFAFQSAEILGRGNDRVTRETIEAWHTSTNSTNRCVALPEAYQALRTQLREQTSKRGLRGERNAITAGSMGDTNAAALQLGSGEGAIVTTVATPTCPAGEKTDGRSNINEPDEGASVTATYPAGENTGCRGVVKKIASLGRELRSMRTRAMTASARTPAPDERGEDQDYTCPHCDRTFTSHIGLVGHLRIHRTETGEPMPGAPTFTHRTRLHCPHCPSTFTHRMDLFGHLRIHERRIDRSPETPTTSNTPTMPSPTLVSSHCAPIATTTTTITSVADADKDTADYSCPPCDRTFTSHIGLVGHLRIHRTEAGKPVPGAPTYTHRTRIHCPHCPRTFTHRMSLFGHMRIHEHLR
ncbi:hypothetical protein SprV_0702341800 [Sparganum proliferum]